MAKTNLSAERLREFLDFDPETGRFTSKIERRKGPNPWRIGQVIDPRSTVISIDGKPYQITQLAWLHHYGHWPRTKIIFLNGDSGDLRVANMAERSSGDELTADRLRALLEYNPETGAFVRRVRTSNRITAGSDAGSIHAEGYVVITVDGVKYKAHRLAWLYTTGAWPIGEIDHINGIKHDNRMVNLRDTDRIGNTQNIRKARRDNGHGLLGVQKVRTGWKARIQVAKRSIYLGTFKTAEEAHATYLAAKREIHATCSI